MPDRGDPSQREHSSADSHQPLGSQSESLVDVRFADVLFHVARPDRQNGQIGGRKWLMARYGDLKARTSCLTAAPSEWDNPAAEHGARGHTGPQNHEGGQGR